MANAYTALHGRDRRGGGSEAEGLASAPPRVKSPKKNEESALFETPGPRRARPEGHVHGVGRRQRIEPYRLSLLRVASRENSARVQIVRAGELQSRCAKSVRRRIGPLEPVARVCGDQRARARAATEFLESH